MPFILDEGAASLPPSETLPEGPAFVLVKKKGSFRSSNPFHIKRSLDQFIGPVKSVKALQSGSLLIETENSKQTVTLMNMTNFADNPVQTQLAHRLNTVEGAVRSEALTELSNAELLDELKGQGVVKVQRLKSRNLEKMGPNPTVRLWFAGRTLPQILYCGYMRVQVTPWIYAPRPCPNCLMYGHSRRACRRRNPRCGRCSGGHPTHALIGHSIVQLLSNTLSFPNPSLCVFQ